jgi:hypothetical protein
MELLSNATTMHHLPRLLKFKRDNSEFGGSSVSIMSGYRLDDRAIQVSYPAEAKDYSSNL